MASRNARFDYDAVAQCQRQLHQWYCVEDMSLSEVKESFECFFAQAKAMLGLDFKVSERQWRRRLQKWGITKQSALPEDAKILPLWYEYGHGLYWSLSCMSNPCHRCEIQSKRIQPDQSLMMFVGQLGYATPSPSAFSSTSRSRASQHCPSPPRSVPSGSLNMFPSSPHVAPSKFPHHPQGAPWPETCDGRSPMGKLAAPYQSPYSVTEYPSSVESPFGREGAFTHTGNGNIHADCLRSDSKSGLRRGSAASPLECNNRPQSCSAEISSFDQIPDNLYGPDSAWPSEILSDFQLYNPVQRIQRIERQDVRADST